MFPNIERSFCASITRGAWQIIAAAAFITACSSTLLGGQGRYTVGATADVSGGGNGPNLQGNNITQNPDNFAAFIGTYPSLAFKARGERSSLAATYGFGYDRNYTNPTYETRTHNATLAFSSKLGPKWALNLTDTFTKTSDISSYRLLSGTTPDPEQFQFAFTPVFARSNKNNTAGVELERTISKKSSLTISGSYSTLDYPEVQLVAGVLSDQQRISGLVKYKHTGEHYSWTLGYSGARFNFAAFQNSLSHSAVLGYSYQFSPSLSLQLDAGPSYLDSLENIKNPVGANVAVALSRMIPKGAFTLRVSQTGGDTSGLGSVSRNREVLLVFDRTFGRATTVTANVSGFNTQGLQVNALSARGISTGGNIGFALARDWSLNWGGQYQHYEGYNTPGYDQKRLFVSLRYSNPGLWRF